jgi:hypothetical protein
MGEHSLQLTASCRCGLVSLETHGKPIMSVACHCKSCQEAGRQFEQNLAASVLDTDGGTGYVLFRKDRVTFATGTDQLQEFRLTPSSPTRRVVARCCGSPMFVEFSSGHWLSLYTARFPEGSAPLEARTMTKDRREGVVLPNDVPNYSTHSGKFMWKLLTAWIAMGFRAPKVAP